MALGRPKKAVEEDLLLDLLSSGWDRKAIASELGVTTPTLSKRISELRQKEGEILQYRALQSLELTELEAQVLENITPDKIQEAPLRDLVMAFKILKDKELVSEGRPTEIKGLVGYLMHLEKEEAQPVQIIEQKLDHVPQEQLNKTFEETEEEEEFSDESFLFPMHTGDTDKGDLPSAGSPFPSEDLPDL